MEITHDELARLKNAIDYMQNAMLDVVGFANDANTKVKFMHECKRVHELAANEIEEIQKRGRLDVNRLA
jgi:hypothetical protein